MSSSTPQPHARFHNRMLCANHDDRRTSSSPSKSHRPNPSMGPIRWPNNITITVNNPLFSIHQLQCARLPDGPSPLPSVKRARPILRRRARLTSGCVLMRSLPYVRVQSEKVWTWSVAWLDWMSVRASWRESSAKGPTKVSLLWNGLPWISERRLQERRFLWVCSRCLWVLAPSCPLQDSAV